MELFLFEDVHMRMEPINDNLHSILCAKCPLLSNPIIIIMGNSVALEIEGTS
jgi:hypothetical protein